jgi:hypothetical protein
VRLGIRSGDDHFSGNWRTNPDVSVMGITTEQLLRKIFLRPQYVVLASSTLRNQWGLWVESGCPEPGGVFCRNAQILRAEGSAVERAFWPGSDVRKQKTNETEPLRKDICHD